MDLRTKFVAAFGNLHESCFSLSARDFRNLKDDIATLRPEDLKIWLPGVLIRAMEDSKKDSRLSSTDDHLIYLLDGYHDSEKDADEKAYSREVKELLFEGYTHSQAAAIRGWLETVEQSEFVKICPNDYRSALRYWKDRETRGFLL